MQIIIDTNILIYCYDTSDPRKHDIANQILTDYAYNISFTTQILSEFSSVMLRKKYASEDIHNTVKLYSKLMTVYLVEPKHTLKAIEATKKYRMSFWDAQIWAVAVSNRIPEILTEDGPVKQTIEGVTWRNPFA